VTVIQNMNTSLPNRAVSTTSWAAVTLQTEKNTLTVSDCTFTNVQAQNGGVFYVTDQCDITLTDNDFDSVSSTAGGWSFLSSKH